MENKQTAIGWLIEKTTESGHLWLTDKPYSMDELSLIIEKAKEIEKQQLIEFAEFVATYPDKNRNVNGDMLHAKSKYDGAERTIDLLETFKGK